ncbi:helix-turn-helix domain-containing protein [Falsigemmobacter faecalis]|uniref:Plasmid replication protein C N-terminal domain-containing protein n=1 Tax=Falsigemmobacter faecalis TaxID=2488730 RepID=A0A3P3DCI6_9RHOB|nr:helix-turn-helix domain-containing protein [Falsigemmobacter faecalis]RRH72047.1 hypothetical protein EG244_15580 [Falsigemmobacter faecalis]
MNKITKPADFAGLVQHAVPLAATAYVGCGEIIAQPIFEPVARRDIMAAVNTCRRELGLSPGVLVTLDALLSCLPCPAGQNGLVTHKMLLTVYASNETLCFRAKGITDRQLRRHIDTLEKQGLLLRRDSANGKRFPLMRGGQVIGAFGLDLTPLFLRATDIIGSAQLRREQDQELRGLRAKLRHLCARILDLDICNDIAELLCHFTRLARRASLTLTEVTVAIHKATEMIEASAQKIAEEPLEVSVSAGHSDRLINPESNTIKTKQAAVRTQMENWEQFTELSTFFPPPSSKTEAQKTACLFGQMLGLQHSTLAKALYEIPVLTLLEILNRMALKINEIPSPTGYLRSAIKSAQQTSPGHLTSLTSFHRQVQ